MSPNLIQSGKTYRSGKVKRTVLSIDTCLERHSWDETDPEPRVKFNQSNKNPDQEYTALLSSFAAWADAEVE